MPELEIAPSPALPVVARASRRGRPDGVPGVTAIVREFAACVQISPWRGHRTSAARALHQSLGADPPSNPGAAQGAGAAIIVWGGPEGWLVVDRTGQVAVEWLAEQLGGTCAIVDQSDGKVLIELGGPHARDVLAKGMEPDFHDTAFPIGSAAVGKLCHLACYVWRLEDHFGLLVPRSAAGDVWHWLVESALEFGIEIKGDAVAGD